MSLHPLQLNQQFVGVNNLVRTRKKTVARCSKTYTNTSNRVGSDENVESSGGFSSAIVLCPVRPITEMVPLQHQDVGSHDNTTCCYIPNSPSPNNNSCISYNPQHQSASCSEVHNPLIVPSLKLKELPGSTRENDHMDAMPIDVIYPTVTKIQEIEELLDHPCIDNQQQNGTMLLEGNMILESLSNHFDSAYFGVDPERHVIMQHISALPASFAAKVLSGDNYKEDPDVCAIFIGNHISYSVEDCSMVFLYPKKEHILLCSWPLELLFLRICCKEDSCAGSYIDEEYHCQSMR
ncbi:unnamed protein product [Urochloa humidicola]